MFRCYPLLSLAKRAGLGVFGVWMLMVVSAGRAQTSLGLNLDLATYLQANGAVYLEIYYAFPAEVMTFIGDAPHGYTSQALLTLHIFKKDSLWSAKQWKLERKVENLATRDSTVQIVDALRYVIDAPDLYRVVLYARDINRPDRLDSAIASIKVRQPPATELGLSEVQLATNIRKAAADTTGAFVKNNFVIVPNPSRLFGEGSTALYYYFEVYNMLNNVPGDKYKARCVVKNSNGQVVPGLLAPDRTRKKLADANMEMGMIDVASLPSGTYSLAYGIVDLSGKMLAAAEKKFYIYNPQVQAEAGAMAVLPTASQLDLLTDKQLDEEFEQMQYLTTRDEKKFYKNLENASGKRQFIQSLWASPKPLFAVAGPALRQEYLQRLERANALYSTAYKPGWKTDRGRVYILYGSPSNVERHASTSESKPYEIWSYEALQGGVIFVFADRYGFRNYELVHSDMRGELANTNWRALVETQSGTMPR